GSRSLLAGHPAAGYHPGPPQGPVELPQILRPLQGGRPILLLQKRRAPEPGRAVRDGVAGRQAPRPARPQQVVQGRHGRPVRDGPRQDDDVLVYRRPDHPDWGFQGTVTEDARYLVISTWKGTDEKNRVTYKDLTEPYGMALDLIDDFNNEYAFVGNDGPLFYF